MPRFIQAKPVWLAGREREMNCSAGFKAEIVYRQGKCLLTMTGSTFYKAYVNGAFLHFGPAKAAHGHVRIDCIDLSQALTQGVNILAVEVAGYYCPAYNGVRMPSFLQAEVVLDGGVIAYTAKGGDFSGVALTSRIQKTGRYSYQRHFTESYRLDHSDSATDWINDRSHPAGSELMELDCSLIYLEREAPVPDYRRADPFKWFPVGNAAPKAVPGLDADEFGLKRVLDLTDGVRGFPAREIETRPLEILEKYDFPVPEPAGTDAVGPPLRINRGEFAAFSMKGVKVGFACADVTALEDSEISILFDEKLTGGFLKTENGCLNIIEYSLKRNEKPYSLRTFEPYGLMYGAVFVRSGRIHLNGFFMIEFAHPPTGLCSFRSSDGELNLLFDAARESFRHNALDGFMDCASRERAGWLCDSCFTARGEPLWGIENRVERFFMENYRLYPGIGELPPGMLPMCYPADHADGCFIPQWAMWFIVQLDEYLRRDPQADPSQYERLCYGLLQFLDRYVNGDGLLEGLPSWSFIDWSDANAWVQDVSYPTNMLYGRILWIVGALYGNDALKRKAEKVREQIIAQSFDGAFFADNARRGGDGRLHLTGNRSEACQYYAFYFRTADPGEPRFSALQQTLISTFGPGRGGTGAMPGVAKCNAFVGNMLRMDLLLQWGRHEKLLDEIKTYYGGMARLTGTLWEMMEPSNSLDHGFASYIGVLIVKMLSGVADIDERSRRITIQDGGIPLEADIVIPLRRGSIFAKRRIRNGKSRLELRIPPDYDSGI